MDYWDAKLEVKKQFFLIRTSALSGIFKIQKHILRTNLFVR
jgi:hypothetical protein